MTGTNQAPNWKDKHYLVADDVLGIRQLLRESLRSLGARHIDLADSGSQAIHLLSQNKYDVVFCDYNLGEGKNGQQVLEEAKVRDLMLPSSVWLVVSAEKSVESVIGAAEHQPDAYLLKPITESVLLSRLNRAWHKKQLFRAADQAYAEKDYLRAAKLCEAEIPGNPGHSAELLRMKANLLQKAGQHEQAREVYERVLAEREYQWAQSGLAKIRMQNGEYEVARAMFQGILAANKYYIDAYDQLAVAHQRLGQFDDAARVLEKAVSLSPNSVLRQKSLGEVALKLGNIAVAEKAFRKCIAIGEYSVRKTPDAYMGLARLCGLKNDPKEALHLLATAQKDFLNEETRLRTKIIEGLIHHESGDYRRARQVADEMETMLTRSPERPDIATCLELARMLLAVGVKQAGIDLLGYLIKNNHDQPHLLEEIQQIFNKARIGEIGGALIASSRKEASDLMNHGVWLWKSARLEEAVEWMRNAKAALPTNQRILFNCAQVMISHMQQYGFSNEMADEARAVLMQVDKIAPGQQRFAQLMEMLAEL